MDTEISRIAAALRATDDMAAGFAERVQERLGWPVTHAEILAVMNKIPARSLSMDKVVSLLRRGSKGH